MNKIRNFALKAIALGLSLGFNSSMKADGPIERIVGMKPTIQAAMARPIKVARSAANMVAAMARHPKITATVAMGSAALYIACKKAYVQDWTAAITRSQEVTRSMLRNVSKPGDKYAYLLFEELPTAHDIVNKTDMVYSRLLNCSERDEPSVIKTIIKDISKQRDDLENIKAGLEKCLHACTLYPQLEIIPSDDEDAKTENSVTQIIDSNKQRLGFNNKKFYELSNDAIATIHKEIMNESSVSILNPYKLFRYWMFPFESAAMREYWKIRQLIERLNAIEYCLNQRSVNKNNRLSVVAI